MSTERTVIELLGRTLSLGDRVASWSGATRLLGSVAEFDSMAVVAVLTAIEEEFGISVGDDDVDASTFETVGSLARFVDSKR